MATERQSRAMRLYKENYGKNVPIGQIMLAAGYSESAAKNPKVLTESMDWQQMMDEFLPDDALLGAHKSMLQAKKLAMAEFPNWLGVEEIRAMITDQGGTPRNYEANPITGMVAVWYWIPDYMAQKVALDLAYKLKGKIKASGDVNVTVTPPPVALVEFLGGDGPAPSQDPVR
ncbi:hypothetical protein AB0P19_06980 [Microbacterium oleivorans]|uniref:hypothetical protein n=2 Tax=Microbacterium oleivorans TaxID=273677 RepID=UPI00343D49A4